MTYLEKKLWQVKTQNETLNQFKYLTLYACDLLIDIVESLTHQFK